MLHALHFPALTLRFDCKPCEMHVVGRMKKSVLNQHAKEMQAVPMQFCPRRAMIALW